MNNENDNELLSLDDVGGYSLPEQKEIVIDLAQNKVLDSKDIPLIEMIYMTAQEKGIALKKFPIKNGLIDSGCKRAGCHGRGYTGFAGTTPIPCVCIFEDKKNIKSDGVSINRGIIRNYEKALHKDKRKFFEERLKFHGLKPLGNGVYGKIKKGTKELLKYAWIEHEHEGKKNWDFRRIYNEILEGVAE